MNYSTFTPTLSKCYWHISSSLILVQHREISHFNSVSTKKKVLHTNKFISLPIWNKFILFMSKDKMYDFDEWLYGNNIAFFLIKKRSKLYTISFHVILAEDHQLLVSCDWSAVLYSSCSNIFDKQTSQWLYKRQQRLYRIQHHHTLCGKEYGP